jgi:hypothetical protein
MMIFSSINYSLFDIAGEIPLVAKSLSFLKIIDFSNNLFPNKAPIYVRDYLELCQQITHDVESNGQPYQMKEDEESKEAMNEKMKTIDYLEEYEDDLWIKDDDQG